MICALVTVYTLLMNYSFIVVGLKIYCWHKQSNRHVIEMVKF